MANRAWRVANGIDPHSLLPTPYSLLLLRDRETWTHLRIASKRTRHPYLPCEPEPIEWSDWLT